MAKKSKIQLQYLPFSKLVFLSDNPRTRTDSGFAKMVEDIKADPSFYENRPTLVNLVNGEFRVYAGDLRAHAAHDGLGWSEIPCNVEADVPEEVMRRRAILDNTHREDWDKDALSEWEFERDELEDMGVDVDWVSEDEDEDGENAKNISDAERHATLSDIFIAPPFSVIDTKQGYWIKRKDNWMGLGIRSEVGRDATAYVEQDRLSELMGSDGFGADGVSVFDPALCEVIYKWFCIDGGMVLDPFAGGSVRGIVAQMCGRQYIGIDIREDQVIANRENAKDVIGGSAMPIWHCGNSINIDKICNGVRCDLIFSCPPYADLEVYSDIDGDISNMDYSSFLGAYRVIIKNSVSMLKDNSFAVFVVGEIRDKKGIYRNFVADTISAFIDAGMLYYNEIIYVTPIGSLPVRVGRQFNSGRKVGKTHQNILVFYKGDAKAIKSKFGTIELPETTE